MSTAIADDLQSRVDAVPYWYHHIDLPGGIVTPGNAPLSAEAYRIPEDLSGKRILDVGSWDGYWCWEALKRGAAFVTAIDDHSDNCGHLTPDQQSPPWYTWDLCRDALGYVSRCRRVSMSLYDIEKLQDRFDVIFFFGVLYHCKHPLLAFERLHEVCDGEIYCESAVLDDYYSAYADRKYTEDDCCAEFYPFNEYGSNHTNWWVPTTRCMASMMHVAGFRDIEAWRIQNPNHVSESRGFAKGLVIE